MNNDKPWYLSKTLWFGVAVLAGEIIDLLAGSDFVKTYAPSIIPTLVVAYTVLRTITTTALTK